MGLDNHAWIFPTKKRKIVAQSPKILRKFHVLPEKTLFLKISTRSAVLATPPNVSRQKFNEFLVRVPKSLRKAIFSQVFFLHTWKSALKLTPRNFCRKAESFSLTVRKWFKKFKSFEKSPRLFLCDSHYSSEFSNCSYGQRAFSSDTPAERLWPKGWKVSLTPKFFPAWSKRLPAKFQKWWKKLFSRKIFIWVGSKQLWHPSWKAFAKKIGSFSSKCRKRSTVQVCFSKRNGSAIFSPKL